MQTSVQVPLDLEQIAEFCRGHHIERLWLFGSVLRDDFGPHSDIDVLVQFNAKAPLSFWDVVQAQEELADLLGRPVDLIELEALRNPFLRSEISRTRHLVYAA